MKKSLLILGLLGMASSVYAQTTPPFGVGRWAVVNTTAVNTFDGYALDDIHATTPTLAWGLTYDSNAATIENKTYIRSNNATGTEFDFGPIGDAATPAFRAANIVGISLPGAQQGRVALASTFNSISGGGQIIRTANGGTTWTAVQGANMAAPLGFNNFVHMFNATDGVSFGDPNSDGTPATPYFEVLRTTNGGLTWTRRPSSSVPPRLNEFEGGLTRSYFSLPGTNIIWAGGASFGPTPGPARMFKSVDGGLNWTVANTPLTSQINRIAFKDALNGIAFNRLNAPGTPTTPPAPGSINVIRTTDGGLTWTTITPANVANGKFFAYDIDAVPASGTTPGFYISVGFSRVPNAAAPNPNDTFGSSTSTDGITWRDIDNGILVDPMTRRVYTCVDILSTTAGYAGGIFQAGTGAGGVYRLNAATPLPTRAAAAKSMLSAYPNPSTGVFEVQLESGVKTVTQLTVTDALGRVVYSRTLTPSTANSGTITVDLTKEKTGVYVMELRNEAGVSQKKVVVQ